MEAVDWVVILAGVGGGLALFLLGLDALTHAIKKLAGGGLRSALQRMTTNRISGAVTGVLVTAAVNSSSVTTVLVVGFVSAGILDLGRAVAVIMGANIGSTVTAQLIAFDLGLAALGGIALGFLLKTVSRSEAGIRLGESLLGLGLIFHGMVLMGDSLAPLRDHPGFIAILTSLGNPLYGIVAGALFTALVQSSAATTGIAISMASAGVMSLEAGIALTLGANIGTCMTAVLAAIGRPIAARQTAAIHVLFNLVGVAIWVPALDLLMLLAQAFAPAGDVARGIANAHTIFNVANTILFLPFTGSFAWLARRLVQPSDRPGFKPWHLDPGLIGIPPLALAAAHLELGRFGDDLLESLLCIHLACVEQRRDLLDDIADDRARQRLHADAIFAYLGRLRREDFSPVEGERFHVCVGAARHLDSAATLIGDLAETLAALAEAGIEISPTMRGHLHTLAKEVIATFNETVAAVRENDADAADLALARKAEVKRLADLAFHHLVDHLADGSDRSERMRLETNLIDLFRRLHDQARNAAKAIRGLGEAEA